MKEQMPYKIDRPGRGSSGSSFDDADGGDGYAKIFAQFRAGQIGKAEALRQLKRLLDQCQIDAGEKAAHESAAAGLRGEPPRKALAGYDAKTARNEWTAKHPSPVVAALESAGGRRRRARR